MAKAMRRLQKKVRAEQAAIQKAAKKRGLWSSLGSALVGGVAMLATGGAASPFVAGLFAGGASAVGGHLGNYLAGQSPGGKIKGGRFFQGQRADLAKQIKDKINVGAVKTAIKVGGMNLMGKMGGKLKVGKGGVSAELPMGEIAKGETAAKTNIFESIFKGGDTGTANIPDAFLTKGGKVPIGNLIDFKGSTLGKGLQHIQSKALERQFRKEGWIDPNLQGAAIEGGKPIVAMDRFEGMAKQRVADIQEAQSAARLTAAKQAPQIAGSTLRRMKSSDPSYLGEIEKVGPSKFAGTGAAQTEAIMAGEVPEWYGAPKGTTWRETALDPGMSDLSFAGSYATSDEGFTGPLEESVPFDRSSMLNRQASARYQASANIFKQNFPEFSGSGSPMGAGTDETRTGLWESVGTSFPVQSPDIVGGFGSLPEYGVQGQNMINPLGSKFRTGLKKSSAWHKRLFGDY